MPVPDLFTANRVRRRVTVRGVVQGVGFRPHVYALARSLHLSGAVWNTGDGVVVEIEGAPGGAEAFTSRVRAEAPPLALVSGVDVEEIELQGGTEFVIRESEQAAGRTFVAPDVTICDDCLADLRDPAQPPLPAPVRDLHQLRPALHDHHRAPVRPAGHDDGRLRDVRGLRGRVRRPGRPPLPRPDRLLPRLRAAAAPGRTGPHDDVRRGRPRRGARDPPRGRRSSRSRASAATTWPATRPTATPWRCCASASSAGTSRSR